MIAYRAKTKAIFLVRFAKSEKQNISPDELTFLRNLAENWLAANGARIPTEIELGNLQEIEVDEKA